jgi:hypothetical protein
MANHAAYFEQVEADFVRRAAERAERRSRDPKGYAERTALLGWGKPVRHPCAPPLPPVEAPEREHCADCGKYTKGLPHACKSTEYDPSQLQGYKVHLSIDAITEAIKEIRAERRRTSNQPDSRDHIKAAYQHTFWRCGLRLVKIPNWHGMPE